MLTRLEVQGFANLLDVDLRLGPLTVLIGHNGAGKTNVLAAARLLSLLARFPIDEAVSRLGPWEGERASPLTRLDGWTAPRLRLAAELIVEQEVRDCLGVSAAASTATLRYEVVLVPREREAGLALLSESLVPIRHTEAHRKTRAWATRTLRDSFTFGRRAQPLVSTDEGTIRIHHDGQAARQLLACDSPATTLCGAASADFPTLLAARRALEAVVDLELPADGGSRLTALGALAATASAGTCCIEQPDAGVHPDRCTELATLLRDGAVDPSRALGEDNAPRQLLCTTHSPVLVEALSPTTELVYLDRVEAVREGGRGHICVPRYPAGSWRLDSAGPEHTLRPRLLRPYFRNASSPKQLELVTEVAT